MTFKDLVYQPVHIRVNPLIVFGACLAVILIFIAVDVAFFMQGASFKREGGGLETATAVLYCVAAVSFLRVAPEGAYRTFWHIPVLLTLFAMRELDMDKAFTPAGILSTKLYAGDAALSTKLISGAVALGVLAVALRTLRHGLRPMRRAWADGARWPWFAAVTTALLGITKSIDGLGRKLLDFGIVISNDVDATAALLEETGESLIPVFAIMAIYARWRGGIHDTNPSRSPPAH